MARRSVERKRTVALVRRVIRPDLVEVTALRHVTEDDPVVNPEALQLGQHGVESASITVNVRDQSVRSATRRTIGRIQAHARDDNGHRLRSMSSHVAALFAAFTLVAFVAGFEVHKPGVDAHTTCASQPGIPGPHAGSTVAFGCRWMFPRPRRVSEVAQRSRRSDSVYGVQSPLAWYAS